MNTNIKFKSSPAIGGIHRSSVSFVKVEIASLEKHERSFTLYFESKELKVEILLKGMAANYLKDILNKKEVKKKLTSRYYSIEKSGNDSFNLRFGFPAIPILEHDFISEPYILSNDKATKPSVQYDIELRFSPKQLEQMKNDALVGFEKRVERREERILRRQKKKIRKIERETNKTLNNNKKKTKVQKTVSSFEEMEKLKEMKKYENNRMLKNNGVFLTNPNVFKRCDNCVNFDSKGKCSAYFVEVSENHSCKRFHSYKTVLGGAFSPR